MAVAPATLLPRCFSSVFAVGQPIRVEWGDLTRRILYLDGLRGWAALFVLFHHLLLAFAPDGHEAALNASPVAAPLGFLADGPLAVAIFFILSGIVLMAAVTAAQERAA